MGKWRIYRRVVIWVALAVALTSTDWPFGTFSSFWRTYAFATGMASGLVLLGFGLFAVEAWFKHREAHRWTQMTRVGAKELGYATDNLLCAMDYLVTGELDERDGLRIEDRFHEQLLTCLGRLDPTRDCGETRTREAVAFLMEDAAWVKLAVAKLDRVKHQHRRNLTIWVPLVLTVDKMTPLVNESAELNEAVFLLQDMLRVVLDREVAPLTAEEVCKAADSPVLARMAASRQWESTRSQIVRLQERCMRAADLVYWQNPKMDLHQ